MTDSAESNPSQSDPQENKTSISPWKITSWISCFVVAGSILACVIIAAVRSECLTEVKVTALDTTPTYRIAQVAEAKACTVGASVRMAKGAAHSATTANCMQVNATGRIRVLARAVMTTCTAQNIADAATRISPSVSPPIVPPPKAHVPKNANGIAAQTAVAGRVRMAIQAMSGVNTT